MIKDMPKRNWAGLIRPDTLSIESKICGTSAIMKTADQKISIIAKNWLPTLSLFFNFTEIESITSETAIKAILKSRKSVVNFHILKSELYILYQARRH